MICSARAASWVSAVGPGTNAHLFAHADYPGVDINPDYIAYARKKFRRPFVVAGVSTYEVPPDQRFDFHRAQQRPSPYRDLGCAEHLGAPAHTSHAR